MDKKILAAGMQKGFVSVVVAYFLAIALGILAGIWENHYLMIVVQFTSTVFIRLFKFLSIPIICVSIIASLSTLSQSNESGRIFKHTSFLYAFDNDSCRLRSRFPVCTLHSGECGCYRLGS